MARKSSKRGLLLGLLIAALLLCAGVLGWKWWEYRMGEGFYASLRELTQAAGGWR